MKNIVDIVRASFSLLVLLEAKKVTHDYFCDTWHKFDHYFSDFFFAIFFARVLIHAFIHDVVLQVCMDIILFKGKAFAHGIGH